ncbi:MAG: glutamate-5-semialdehyde dehydrogenase [Planctomycetota bacterium]|nr:MAG: glutamate-5-semialdehyde dehydrogenase [Planctomycetota bacterium]GDY08862.1 gamma-glutamyl phosphate reductase [Planctomycetia bacterium]
MSDLHHYALTTAQKARTASRALVSVTSEQKNAWLNCSAELLRARSAELIAANQQDLDKAPEFGLSDAAIDRLRLNESRIGAIADALRDVVALPDPVGELIDSTKRPNGLLVTRVRVPLGVVFFIYESRPNVTVDAAALCVKSGNAVILRGGKEAFHSNTALHRVLSDALRDTGLPTDSVQLVSTTNREAVGHFLKLRELIDLTIPRGGKSLIERVAAEATMPVMKHFDGVCHVFVDRTADLAMAENILVNSKCQRPGVCNAAETLLVHADVAKTFLPRAAEALGQCGVELRCCDRSLPFVKQGVSASEQDFRTEYLDLKLSVKTVDSLDDAIRHINDYGSHHTDAIVTQDSSAAEKFCREVDSAATHVNCSTRFNDGGEYGLGAEIGISTDKFHARGPCGLRELTSYKWVVHGQGQIRG